MKWLLPLILLLHQTRAGAQHFFPVPPPSDTAQFVQNLARTAWLLHSSDTPVRIMVYGQSISVQNWWKDVRDDIVARFPKVHIEFINKAIGGFSSERLKLMVDNDMISFYPDLVILHDYGNEPDYETIVQTIRRRTTADIAIQTDHMADQRQDWHDRHNQQWLPELCRKYGLALIDVRSAWKQYLKDHSLSIADLLVDGVHLNDHGNYLMGTIIRQYFATLQQAKGADRYVQHMLPGRQFRVRGGQLQTAFDGNRADLIWKTSVPVSGDIQVLIDERKPSTRHGCYYYTRPAFDTAGFLRKIGQPLAMTLSDDVREEDWSLTILAADSVRQQMKFSVRGSLTGDDGIGSSDSTFVSRSGKITLRQADWFRAQEFARFPWVGPGDVLHWQVRCMCRDSVNASAGKRVTVVQGLNNGPHVLKLTGRDVQYVKEILAYKPPLK